LMTAPRRHKQLGGDIAQLAGTVVERSISGDERSGPDPPPSGLGRTVARWDRTARDMGGCQVRGSQLRQTWWLGPVGTVLLFVGVARCAFRGVRLLATPTPGETLFPPGRLQLHTEVRAS
jgi:hypothetical protein